MKLQASAQTACRFDAELSQLGDAKQYQQRHDRMWSQTGLGLEGRAGGVLANQLFAEAHHAHGPHSLSPVLKATCSENAHGNYRAVPIMEKASQNSVTALRLELLANVRFEDKRTSHLYRINSAVEL